MGGFSCLAMEKCFLTDCQHCAGWWVEMIVHSISEDGHVTLEDTVALDCLYCIVHYSIHGAFDYRTNTHLNNHFILLRYPQHLPAPFERHGAQELVDFPVCDLAGFAAVGCCAAAGAALEGLCRRGG